LATPAAIVPTAEAATSLTPIRAPGLIARRSAISWGEILDRVDVVVRRRADQTLAGLRLRNLRSAA